MVQRFLGIDRRVRRCAQVIHQPIRVAVLTRANGHHGLKIRVPVPAAVYRDARVRLGLDAVAPAGAALHVRGPVTHVEKLNHIVGRGHDHRVDDHGARTPRPSVKRRVAWVCAPRPSVERRARFTRHLFGGPNAA